MLPANLERTDGVWRSGQGGAVTGGERPGSTDRTGPAGTSGNPASDDELARRRDRLGASLTAKGLSTAAAEKRRDKPAAAGYGQALKLSSEFIAGVGVGAGIGWFVDRMAGTSPFGLIVFLLLGFAAGVLNVMRSAGVVAEAGIRSEKRSGDREG
jgi:ATP synthase protein I